MKIKSMFLSIVLFICSTFLFAQQDLIGKIETRQIKVIGSAEKFITPNEIFVGITMEDIYHGKTLISLEESERVLLKLLDSLRIDKKDIFIHDYYFKSKQLSRRNTQLVKTKHYTVKLADFEKVDKLISDLKKGNFQNCEIEKFSHSEMPLFRKEVKVAAVKAAKEKAQSLLEPLNAAVGKVLLVEELPYSKYTPRSANMSLPSASMSSDITFKNIRLYFEITVIFEIIDK